MNDTQSDSRTITESDNPDPLATSEDVDVLLQTTPTLRPTLLLMGMSIVVGFAAIGFLLRNPTTVGGDAQLTELVRNAIAVLLLLILIRLTIRIFVLRRTRYVIREDVLRREYTLLYRHWAREVPIRQLRGHEYSQSRIQTLLGYGTIRMLTGGTNQSLGFVEFEDVPDPELVRQYIRQL